MKMNKTYFEEKIKLSCESIEFAANYLQESSGLIKLAHYDMPNLVNAKQVHENLKTAALLLKKAATDFETARWASTSTNLPFEEWLKVQNLD